jgi:hypothetical protein
MGAGIISSTKITFENGRPRMEDNLAGMALTVNRWHSRFSTKATLTLSGYFNTFKLS